MCVCVCVWGRGGGGGVFGEDYVSESRNMIGKAESGGGIRSNQFIGCTYDQLQDICR